MVRALEEIVAPASRASETLHALQPSVGLRTVVHVALVGGGRVGLLAQVAGALASQGLSVSEATIQVSPVIMVSQPRHCRRTAWALADKVAWVLMRMSRQQRIHATTTRGSPWRVAASRALL